MKLLTNKDTDKIFYDATKLGARGMDSKLFNEAVNALLMDAKIVKSLLKQAKRIKEKNATSR
jgi:hypothetical protein